MAGPRFGVGIPTGTEGLMYPIPFASAADNVRIAVAAERFGFDSVWGNDHLSTQHYVRKEHSEPPSYYAPLVVLSAITQATTKLKVGTALLVVPFRHPVVIAKEVATLDHLSGGRVLLPGIGLSDVDVLVRGGRLAALCEPGAPVDAAWDADLRCAKVPGGEVRGKPSVGALTKLSRHEVGRLGTQVRDENRRRDAVADHPYRCPQRPTLGGGARIRRTGGSGRTSQHERAEPVSVVERVGPSGAAVAGRQLSATDRFAARERKCRQA